ncbi:uncharacterized protein EV420DRAFT_1067906 [Desarmillaria tabescens]|uniref:Uncharacterized protein n=1 Tax=Armillaria tabescens TaxID=1929756 RepID=A0AA39JJ58_ARMTA|nr:uncharacterized protein EV420DRAFT_1067906 [Desarmillaria tabescens]KAK0443142.1 hypothetical protein EV420DRAFT_1067906 [Desarmillaria tabescens]
MQRIRIFFAPLQSMFLNRGHICRSDLGTFPGWGENDAILDMPSTSSTTSKPKRHSHKHPVGLGLGHPSSSSLRAAPPPLSLESAGIGMLTSLLSVPSGLCRLTSQPPSKLPPRQPQPQPRSRARARLLLKMPHLTISKFTKRLLYTIPESSTSSLFQGHRCVIGRNAYNEGKIFEGKRSNRLGARCFKKTRILLVRITNSKKNEKNSSIYLYEDYNTYIHTHTHTHIYIYYTPSLSSSVIVVQ